MAEELQGLLEKINKEGVQRAKDEAAKIIAEAEKQAAAVKQQAEEEAKRITAAAKDEAATLKSQAEAAIRQAFRDLLLELKQELENRINLVIKERTKAALTPELMAQVVKNLVADYMKNPDAQVEILASSRDAEALGAALGDALAESLKLNPVILADSGISGGLEIKLSGDDIYVDFSLDAIGEVVRSFVSRKIADVLSGKNN